MIAIDSTEYREGSTMPKIEDAVIVTGLEDATGADAIVSSLDMPISKLALIKEHIAAGALMFQIKRNTAAGSDLASSIVDKRLKLSIARMRELAPQSYQMNLVTTGIITDRENNNSVWIDGREVNTYGIGYKQIQSALRHWNLQGGHVHQVNRLSELDDFFHAVENDLMTMPPKLLVYPDAPELTEPTDNPFQTVQRIKDGRIPLSHLIGPVAAQIMYETCKGDIAMCFHILSDPFYWDALPKGVYKHHADKFCERMGMNGRRFPMPSNPAITDDY